MFRIRSWAPSAHHEGRHPKLCPSLPCASKRTSATNGPLVPELVPWGSLDQKTSGGSRKVVKQQQIFIDIVQFYSEFCSVLFCSVLFCSIQFYSEFDSVLLNQILVIFYSAHPILRCQTKNMLFIKNPPSSPKIKCLLERPIPPPAHPTSSGMRYFLGIFPSRLEHQHSKPESNEWYC